MSSITRGDEDCGKMSMIIGAIESFDLERDNWLAYIERIEQYFIANEITTEEKKRGVLLTVIGSETYNLLRSLVSPEKPSEKSFTQIVNTLKSHLNPKPIVIAERFKFYSRGQLPGEAINAYVAELRKKTEYCEFGAFLEEAIRDKFVCGLSNSSIRKRILSEKDLTLEKAISLASSIEASIKENEAMKSVERVNAISKPKLCFRCNSEQHLADKCRFKQYVCNSC